MVKQYPHTLTVSVMSESTRDESGNWNKQTPTTLNLECRAEPSSGSGFLPGPDGTRIYYDFVVYMPLSAQDIQPGSDVTVKDGDKLISKSTVKRFHHGQLNARAWL